MVLSTISNVSAGVEVDKLKRSMGHDPDARSIYQYGEYPDDELDA